jgi:hypothetical protein
MLYTRLLLLLQYSRELANMALKEFELLLGCLSRRNNLHDGLELRILPRSLRQHVDNRVGRRRLWRRGCLLR